MIIGKLYQVHSEYPQQNVFWKGWDGLTLYSKSLEDVRTGDSVVYFEQINSGDKSTVIDLTYYKLLTSNGNIVYVLTTGGLTMGDPCIAGKMVLKPLEI